MSRCRLLFGVLGINILLNAVFLYILSHFEKFMQDAKFHNSLFDSSWLELIFGAVIFSPLLEETIFRLPLIKTKRNLLLSFIVSIYLLSVYVLIIHFCVLILIWFEYEYLNKKTKNWGFILLSAISFALFHLISFEGELSLISLLWVFPQFITGICLGFIRMRYNFGYTIAYHSLWNLLVVIAYELL